MSYEAVAKTIALLRLSVCLPICVCLCLSAMTLKWHNIVSSQYIKIQLYRRVDIPQRYVDIASWHSSSTRTTAFVTTLAVSPKSLKCNISITNCPIALMTGKHINLIRDNTICILKLFAIYPWIIVRMFSNCAQICGEYGTYGQIRVINATLGQI